MSSQNISSNVTSTDNSPKSSKKDGSNELSERRRRLTQACNVCHLKKVKCDGLKPSCGVCLRTRQTCTYPLKINKRGPRQGQNTRLEFRLETVENKLDSLHRIFSKISDQLGTSQTLPKMTPEPATAPTPEPSLASRFPDGFVITEPTKGLGKLGLVSPELAHHLFKLYFEVYQPIFPILHPSTFFKRYRENDIPTYLLYSMFSIVAKFSNHPQIPDVVPWRKGEVFEAYALSQFIGINNFDLDFLIAMVILCKSLYQRGLAARGWLYGGMAIRVAHFLSIHKVDELLGEGSPASRINWVDAEFQRRIWWSCYTIDGYTCAATGRPPAVQDQLTFVALPNENGKWDQDIHQSVPASVTPTSGEPYYSCYVKLITILNKVGKLINTPKVYLPTTSVLQQHINLLDSLIDSWPKTLPASMQLEACPLDKPNPKPGPPVDQVWYLHALYHTITLILHTSSIDEAFDLSRRKCQLAADNISQLLSQVAKHYDTTMTPFFYNYCLFLSNSFYLDQVSHMEWEPLMKSQTNFASNYRLLKLNCLNWSMAEKYCLLLQELHGKRHANFKASQSIGNNNLTPTNGGFTTNNPFFGNLIMPDSITMQDRFNLPQNNTNSPGMPFQALANTMRFDLPQTMANAPNLLASHLTPSLASQPNPFTDMGFGIGDLTSGSQPIYPTNTTNLMAPVSGTYNDSRPLVEEKDRLMYMNLLLNSNGTMVGNNIGFNSNNTITKKE